MPKRKCGAEEIAAKQRQIRKNGVASPAFCNREGRVEG